MRVLSSSCGLDVIGTKPRAGCSGFDSQALYIDVCSLYIFSNGMLF